MVPGTAVFLFRDAGQAPPAMINNLDHNHVRHESTVLLAIDVTDAPFVEAAEQATVEAVRPGLHQVVLHFGYLDELDVPARLAELEIDGAPVDVSDATYFVGRESVVQSDLEGMHPALEHLYTFLHRNADSATRFFNLPSERVFEVGARVEI